MRTYELTKLKHIWFKEYTYYGEPMPLDMLAKYGTSKIMVFQILEAKHVYDELREFQCLVNAYLQSEEA